MSDANPWSVIQFIAEKRIEEAQAKGEFDNLPGRGRPLELEDMSHVPEELRMAYKILRNAAVCRRNWPSARRSAALWICWNSARMSRNACARWQKLRFMIQQARMRRQRSIQIEQDDPSLCASTEADHRSEQAASGVSAR